MCRWISCTPFYEMIIFNSDLDNTIIYSYKHDIGDDKRCVEIYQGREISFITDRTYELLGSVRREVEMIPTTTRTIEQYKRIDLGTGAFRYALVCNGGILLVDGESDEAWYQESLRLIEESRDKLLESIELLKLDESISFEIRFLNELFVFTKSTEPEKTVAYLKQHLNSEVVDVFNNGVKVYVVPRQLSKGMAIQRLKARLEAEIVIAAGDSEFDISMLEAADYSIMPKELALFEKEKRYIFGDEDLFSEKVLETVLDISKDCL